jgi:hypothetical protein
MLDIFHHKTLYCAWPFIEDILESIWWTVDGINENLEIFWIISMLKINMEYLYTWFNVIWKLGT